VYLPVIAFAAWMNVRQALPSPFGADVAFGALDWLVIAGHDLFFYVAKALVPIHLGVFYPLPNDGVPGLPLHFHAFAVLGAALVALCAWSFGRWRWIFFGTAWYLAAILPSALQPVLVQDPPLVAADRYFYQASLGVFFLAAFAFFAAWDRVGHAGLARGALALAAAASACALLVLARDHVRVFRDTIPLYEQTVLHHPSDAMYYRLAIEYADADRTSSAFHALELAERAPARVFFGDLFGFQMRISDLYRRNGDWAQAAAFLARAIDATPNALEPADARTPLAYRYLASLYDEAGDAARAAAARDAAASARVDPRHYFESNWLVMAPDTALAFLEARVRAAPGDAIAWYYLGRGLHLHGDDARARECLTRAKELGFPPAS
jgi:tetratricopeptide (TPR) repeat protein